MTALTILITAALSLVMSFLGSFLCFVIWVHFDFDARWETRKYARHARQLAAEEHRKARNL